MNQSSPHPSSPHPSNPHDPSPLQRRSDAAAMASGLQGPDLEKLADLARRAALAGGELLRHHFGRLEQVREKGRSGDLVTEADLAAEAAVLSLLAQETPQIGVLAEESGRIAKQGGLEWCVDPLDGTTNYAHGFPLFGTSVGLCWQGAALAWCHRCPRARPALLGSAGLGGLV